VPSKRLENRVSTGRCRADSNRASRETTPLEIEELLSPAKTFGEVQEYAVILARKRHLSLDVLLLAMAASPISVVEEAVYTLRASSSSEVNSTTRSG